MKTPKFITDYISSNVVSCVCPSVHREEEGVKVRHETPALSPMVR